MDCKRAQDLILTDYLDGQKMPVALKEGFQKHMALCPSCQAFKALAEKAVMSPFDGSIKEEVPQEVWQNIKAEILQQEESSWRNVFNEFLEKLKIVLFPKPTLAFASAVSFLLVIMLFMRVVPVGKSYDSAQIDSQGQMEYSTYLMEYAGTSQEVSEGYGTDIEEFFSAS